MYPSAPAGEGRSGASVNTHRRPSNSTDGWSVGVERLAGTSNRNAVVSEGPMEVKSRAFYPAPCSFDGCGNIGAPNAVKKNASRVKEKARRVVMYIDRAYPGMDGADA